MNTQKIQLPAAVVQALESGEQITAIKLLRESSGLGLKEAKDLIEAYQRGGAAPVAPASTASASLPAEVVAAMQAGRKIEAIKLLREHNGMGLAAAKEAVETIEIAARSLAPGEVGRGKGLWWLVLIVIGLLIWAFLRT